MYQNFSPIYKKIAIITLIIVVTFSSFGFMPKRANALAVPNTCQLFDFYCIMDNLKEFVLNKLAVLIANQIIQRMTASIINWINTGFEGNPAFITNPEGFFLDVADQVTGAFLHQSGPLSQLCSPFSFDIRLNLALNQGYYLDQRYACTLSTVIANSQRAIATAGQNSGINITGSPDGASIGDFISGDFSQGGWGGFLAYTVQPQNNPIGASLIAQSDLQSQIASRQANVNADLDRGQGFLSWQSCKDVTANYTSVPTDYNSTVENQTAGQGGNETTVTGQTNLGKSTSIQKKVDKKTGQVKYEDCETQTPGSMIGGMLQRQLNVPTDKLVLVKTISDSVDAILGALVNQMLTQGLAALSDRGSGLNGYNGSYLAQLHNESIRHDNMSAINAGGRANSSSSSIINLAENNIRTYDRIINLLTDTRNRFTLAQVCYTTKLATLPLLSAAQLSEAEQQINAIDSIISTNLDPQINAATAKRSNVQRQLDEYKASIGLITASSTGVLSFNGNYIDEQFKKLESAINTAARTTETGLNNANNADQELRAIQAKVDDLNKEAAKYQESCDAFPNSNTRN